MRVTIKKDGKEKKMLSPINNEFSLREIFEVDSFFLEGFGELDLTRPDVWQLLLDEGVITHAYEEDYWSTPDHLLTELKFSKKDIPLDVLKIIFTDGLRHGFYRKPEELMSCCQNKNFLVFFLSLGYRFKRIKGHGESTMETYFYQKDPKFLDSIMCYPKALDKAWIKKNRKNILGCVITLAVRGDDLTADWVGQLLL
ncbi:hypothetical protein [Thomasclavelia cocleata]|jgi:hypothetical protein|uniref:hypothetical protein n=1 Tax=Thomasclavelia cocleata TaxID=69824 RepID=UPI00256F2B8D|nr:hypothetical protein [Thomasclavelia cocleata]